MKSRFFLILACVSVLGLAGCGSKACGDEPGENEHGTEFGQTGYTQEEEQGMSELQNPDDLQGTDESQTLEVNQWGLTLHAEDVTTKGLTIVCTQSGGSPAGELNTGSYYVLEQEVQGVWCVVEYAENMRGKEVGWDAKAWIIPMNDTVEWKVDWEWLYGSLEPGHYRIGKEIMDFRGTGDYDKVMYYAEFEIVREIL